MKTYEKPRLMALSLSGNNQLCGSCGNSIKLSENEQLAKNLMDMFEFGNIADGVQKEDFAGVFGQEVECTTRKIKNYCKFTSSGENQLVAWS